MVNARFIKPLDENMLISISSQIPKLMTIEENVLQGGFGSAVLEFLNNSETTNSRIKMLGIPDRFIEQGNPERLREKYGLDENGIFNAALSFVKEPSLIN